MVAPGRERRFREIGFTSSASLVDALLPALIPLMDREVVLFGHSVGALIAFETCRRLAAETCKGPILLVVAARVAPQAPRRLPDFFNLTGDALVEAVIRLHDGTIGPPPDPQFIRAMESALRRDFEITDSYVYEVGPPLDTPILAIGTTNDPSTHPSDLEAWASQTTAGFTRHIFEDGGHFFLDHHATALLNLVDHTLRPHREAAADLGPSP